MSSPDVCLLCGGRGKSQRVIDVNIAIMRTFVKLRQMLDSHAKLAEKLMNRKQRACFGSASP